MAGLSETSKCQRCKEGEGALLHRHLHCQQVLPVEVPPMIRQLANKVGGHTGPPELLLSRGLAPMPSGTLPPATKTLQCKWEVKGGEASFVGDVFTDGSGLYPTDPSLRRAGFSVAQLTAQHKLRAVV